MTLSEYKALIDQHQVDLRIKENLRDNLEKDILDLKNKINESKVLKDRLVKAVLLSNNISIKLKKDFFEFLSATATSFLQEIYGPDYAVFFDTHDEQREKGKNDFKCEIRIRSLYNGSSLETGVANSRGGGLIEVTGLAFNLALLKFKSYTGPILLDETLKHLSADSKIIGLASFLKEYSEVHDVQFIFTSHRADVFGKPANKIFQIKNNEENHAVIYETSYEDLIEELNLTEDIEAIENE
jgi:hypothetical protein